MEFPSRALRRFSTGAVPSAPKTPPRNSRTTATGQLASSTKSGSRGAWSIRRPTRTPGSATTARVSSLGSTMLHLRSSYRMPLGRLLVTTSMSFSTASRSTACPTFIRP